MTPQRLHILRVIADSADHPDAEEIHRRVRENSRRVSLATVYRTLGRLSSLRILDKHRFGAGRGRYENGNTRHHDHLIDTETGMVVEFRSEQIEALQHKIASELGYELEGHRLELYGRRRPR